MKKDGSCLMNRWGFLLLVIFFIGFLHQTKQENLASTQNTEYYWEEVIINGPPARSAHAMVFDSHRGRVVLFGGQDANREELGDTWEWDGNQWLNIPVEGPAPRHSHTLVYDCSGRRVILYGGVDRFQHHYADTWSWNGSCWVNLGVTGPTMRYDHGMAYDSNRDVIVMFGGNRGGFLGDTWEFNGSTWEQKFVNGPEAMRAHSMVFDPVLNKVVLFGGYHGIASYDYFGDIWIWDGSEWEKVCDNGPERRDFAFAWDSKNNWLTVHGGESNGYQADTWTGKWSSCLWSRVSTFGPSPRMDTAMAYDELRNTIVLFGGYDGKHMDDTWELSTQNEPPVALCQDIEISVDINCRALITPEDVDIGSYDPDEGDEITLSIDDQGPFSPDVYTITLTVTDTHDESDSCQATVTVSDTTPSVPDLSELPTITGECLVTVTEIPTATDNCVGEVLGTTNDPLTYTEQGTYIITWTYDDGNGNPTIQIQKVIVDDTLPPVIADISASPNILWPPNHKMVPVLVTVSFSDNCDSSPSARIVAITRNEPVDGTGDGDTAPDWEITGDLTVNLRAERSGSGDGRIYTITIQCTDANDNCTTQDVIVTVPHDKKKK